MNVNIMMQAHGVYRRFLSPCASCCLQRYKIGHEINKKNSYFFRTHICIHIVVHIGIHTLRYKITSAKIISKTRLLLTVLQIKRA